MMIDEIKKEIDNIKIYKEKGQLFSHKPLLLLLILQHLKNGRESEWFQFEEIDEALSALLANYSSAKTDPSHTHYPFVFLKSSSLWDIDPIEFKNKKFPKKSEVYGVKGRFNPFVFNFLKGDPQAINQVIDHILTEFWPNRLHEEIRNAVEALFGEA